MKCPVIPSSRQHFKQVSKHKRVAAAKHWHTMPMLVNGEKAQARIHAPERCCVLRESHQPLAKQIMLGRVQLHARGVAVCGPLAGRAHYDGLGGKKFCI